MMYKKHKHGIHEAEMYEGHEEHAAHAEAQREMASDGIMHGAGLHLHEHGFGLFHSKKRK